MGDAITALREDHRRVEKLFKEFEKLEKADADAGRKKKVVAEIVRELVEHAWIEEQVFYPTVREEVEDAEDTVLEGLEEHHIVKWTLSELERMNGDEERFDAKVTVLIESVRHHVEEEEGEMFPKVREVIKRKALLELGERMEAARGGAPGTPQPKAPDEPPAPPAPLKAMAPSGTSSGDGGNGSDGGGKGRGGLLGRRRPKTGAKS
jgi:hemerythrin superfamily protein